MKSYILFILSILSLTVSGQDSIQIENLRTFAKVYGYVKYFHPSDEAANLDWDKFAIYGSEKIEKCKSKEELMKSLDELFRPIAPSILFYDSQKKIKYDLHPITPENIGKYKKTYWQHRGLSFGMNFNNKEGPYNSVRVNRKSKIDNSSEKATGFGNVMTYLRTDEYNGKTIKLTGNVRLVNGTKGDGHLWLRIDKKDKKKGFFNNMDDNPIVDTTWKNYEIEGNVDSNTTGIAFGCFLGGEGKLLVDNIKLYYKENDAWIEIEIGNKGFESEELSTPSAKKTWFASTGDDYKIKITENGCYEGKKCVQIESVDQSVIEKGKKIFEAEPEFGETINKEIGSGISCIIPLVLYCNEYGTFPAGVKIDRDNVDSASTLNVKSLFWGNAIIVWNVFQHFYPYFDVVKVNWDDELRKALMKCYQDQNLVDFHITLEQLTAPLKDGHISVSGKTLDKYSPPISWEFAEGKLVITNVCDASLKLQRGDIVTLVNGIDPKKYFEKFESRISAGTKGWMAYRANKLSLLGEKDSRVTLTVNNESINLIRNNDYFYNECTKTKVTSPSDFKFLDRNIIYLNLDKIEMKTIDSLLPQLTKAKAIICDLRGYPNENHDLISYLLTKDDKDGEWMQIPEFIYPDQERIAGFEKEGWNLEAKKPHLNAKIIFIIDGTAISYAESFMGFIEGYKLATIVGQPTAGTNGNVNEFDLPGHFNISWTGMKVVKHDGSQQHAIGILPNIYVEKTIKGITEGRDEFLEKAIEIAKQQ